MIHLIDEIQDQVHKVLRKAGVPEPDLSLIADHLLDAELCGHSAHGLLGLRRVLRCYQPVLPGEIRVVYETPLSTRFHCGGRSGLVAAHTAMQHALQKAASLGIGLATGSHVDWIGRAGSYARMALARGMIGIATANTPALVAPYGSTQAHLGTNPIAVAVPARSDSILADLSPAQATYSQIRLSQLRGETLPDQVLLDSSGQPTRDPSQVLSGAILTIGGAKGSALAMISEILAGPLAGAKAGLLFPERKCGFLVGAFDPGLFVDRAQFLDEVQMLIDEIHAARKAQEDVEVLVPGEHSERLRAGRLAAGVMDISPEIEQELEYLLA